MHLTGVHFLLTYMCTYECDHCFVWGSPSARGTMSGGQISDILLQAQRLGSVDTVYFEGGEPFLFYPLMLLGLEQAAACGFKRGVVTNAYWATTVDDAVEWLRPIAAIGIDDLSISSDLFHGDSKMTQEARNGLAAARELGIPEDLITIEVPQGCAAFADSQKGAPVTGGRVRFRGRAVSKLLDGVELNPWTDFAECPDEDLLNPGRVHVDAFGNVHVCQGLVIGNLERQSLIEIVQGYDPHQHPIIGPLIAGGPAELVRRHGLPHDEHYADACHLCYVARNALRRKYADQLAPGTVYGDPGGPED
jgi:MoaA/NifB/PqqE/SkfB family radical SAM enzyme